MHLESLHTFEQVLSNALDNPRKGSSAVWRLSARILPECGISTVVIAYCITAGKVRLSKLLFSLYLPDDQLKGSLEHAVCNIIKVPRADRHLS